MKKANLLLLLLNFTFCSFCSFGQDYIPMVVKGVCWKTEVNDYITIPPPEPYAGPSYTLTEDTVINDLTYCVVDYSWGEGGWIRENTIEQKVYYLEGEGFNWYGLNCGEGEEILLYDFSAEVGDTVFQCPNSTTYPYYIVQAIEYHDSNSYYFDVYGFEGGRVFYTSPIGNFNIDVYYEGIGGEQGPIVLPYNVSSYGNEALREYSRKCVFPSNVENITSSPIRIFPNPAQNILNIEVLEEMNIERIQIYNSLGMLEVNEVVLGGNKSINISDLGNGFYFLVGLDDRGRVTFNGRFLKIF